MGFGMGFGIGMGLWQMGWDDGIWDGIWDGMGVGILPFPLIWVASIAMSYVILQNKMLEILNTKDMIKLYGNLAKKFQDFSSLVNCFYEKI